MLRKPALTLLLDFSKALTKTKKNKKQKKSLISCFMACLPETIELLDPEGQ